MMDRGGNEEIEVHGRGKEITKANVDIWKGDKKTEFHE